KVLLPAFGKPSRPTSASSFSSSFSTRCSPSSPGVDCRGERLVELLKCMLPRPPLPPRATSRRSPWRVRSPITSSVSTLTTTVPTGTVMTLSSPPLPYIWLPMPFSPRCALNWRWWRKSTRVLRFSSACSQTSPPSPPSPPSGPPSGMNFSRRKPTQPLPPLPAMTVISASSTSFMESRKGEMGGSKRWKAPVGESIGIPRHQRKAPHAAGPSSKRRARSVACHHAHGATLLGTLDRELDLAVDQREQRVVAAQADAHARMELGAALADDDVAGIDR